MTDHIFAYISPSSLPERELEFVDDDIREMFAGDGSAGASYLIGTPIVAQLVKELRLLRATLEDKAKTTGEGTK